MILSNAPDLAGSRHDYTRRAGLNLQPGADSLTVVFTGVEPAGGGASAVRVPFCSKAIFTSAGVWS